MEKYVSLVCLDILGTASKAVVEEVTNLCQPFGSSDAARVAGHTVLQRPDAPGLALHTAASLQPAAGTGKASPCQRCWAAGQ